MFNWRWTTPSAVDVDNPFVWHTRWFIWPTVWYQRHNTRTWMELWLTFSRVNTQSLNDRLVGSPVGSDSLKGLANSRTGSGLTDNTDHFIGYLQLNHSRPLFHSNHCHWLWTVEGRSGLCVYSWVTPPESGSGQSMSGWIPTVSGVGSRDKKWMVNLSCSTR